MGAVGWATCCTLTCLAARLVLPALRCRCAAAALPVRCQLSLRQPASGAPPSKLMLSIICAVTDCIHPVASSFCLLAWPQVTKESTDEFVGRMQGYLMLYAAVMQVRMMAGHRVQQQRRLHLHALAEASPPEAGLSFRPTCNAG